MSALVTLEQSLLRVQAIQASPELVAYAQLLELPSADLELRIREELEANPALVIVEAPPCPACGSERSPEGCGGCETAWAHPVVPGPATAGTVPERPDAPTPAETLISEARLQLSPRDRPLVELVVGQLDDDGFMRRSPAEVAVELGIEPRRLDAVIAALRDVGPASIGARDVRECLLLQLASLEPSPERDLATVLVSDHLAAFAAGAHARIARELGTTRAAIAAAQEYLRRQCLPRPLVGMRAPDEGSPRQRPDLVVEELPGPRGGLEVRLARSWRPSVALDPVLASLATTAALSRAERRHVADLVHRAQGFAARLAEREHTLGRVARVAVARQAAFVRFGEAFVAPLTRADIARELGVHESTVSRAVAHKLVQLPSGRIVPFADFFDASLPALDMLRRVLAVEGRDLSDTQLSACMRARGYQVARRTVTKYRQRLGVPGAMARIAGDRGARELREGESRFA